MLTADGCVRITRRIRGRVLCGGGNIRPAEIGDFPITVTGKLQKFCMPEIDGEKPGIGGKHA